MTSGRIIITEFMDDAAVEELQSSHHDVLYDPSLVDDPERLIAEVGSADALIVRNRTRLDASVISAAGNLRVVGRLGVGLDNIDLDACSDRDIEVIPATGANSDAVAEYVIASILVLTRGVFTSTDSVLDGEWPRTDLVGREIGGRTLGLVGFGDIARRVAHRAAALGMRVSAHDPYLDPGHRAWNGVEPLDLDTLLRTSDALSVHVPLTDATSNLIDAEALASMPSGAVLVNTSRGGVVDEDAVALSLREGHLGGAALDVFVDEPVTAESGVRLRDVPNLILTPHVAGVTVESNRRVSALIANRVAEALGSGT